MPVPRTPDISLDDARALIERAIDKAEQLGLRGSVAVVDHRGDPIQQDWMPGAPTSAVAVAQCVAAAAGTFHCPRRDLGSLYPGASVMSQLAAALPAWNAPGTGAPTRQHVERLCEQSVQLIMSAGRVRDREDAPRG